VEAIEKMAADYGREQEYQRNRAADAEPDIP